MPTFVRRALAGGAGLILLALVIASTFFDPVMIRLFGPHYAKVALALYALLVACGYAAYGVRKDKRLDLALLTVGAIVLAVTTVWPMHFETVVITSHLDGRPLLWAVGPITVMGFVAVGFASAFALLRASWLLR